jgi:hypothetical protein
MTTDLMEVYSLEEGDTIVHLGQLFRITSLESVDNEHTEILCVDEEGYRRSILVWDLDKVRIVCDTDHLADA